MIRTTKKTVIFRSPFCVNGLNDRFPASVCRVETNKELLESLSVRADRWVRTVRDLPAEPDRPGVAYSLAVAPGELDAAIER